MNPNELTPPPVEQPAAPAQPNTNELPAETLAEFDSIAPTSTQQPTAPPQAAPAAQPTAEQPTEQPAPSTQPAPAKPAAEAQPPAPAQPAAPAAPAKPADENRIELREGQKLKLADDLDLDSGQIRFLVDAWNKGNTRDRAAVDTYKKVFQMEPEQAEQVWAPIITFLTDNARGGGQAPTIVQGVLDALQSAGPRAEEYLARALDTLNGYMAQHPQAAAPAKPAVDPETKRRVDEIDARLQREELTRAQQYITAEREALIKQYPVLADQDVWASFANTALVTSVRNPSYTLTQAAQDQKRLLELWQKSYDANTAQPTTAAPPAPTAVPALVRSGGAAPAVTQAPNPNEELRFNSLDDAKEEFLKSHPQPID